MAEQFKRNIAYKIRIGDILFGKPINDNDKFSFLELGNKKIVRVNLIGNIIDKYDSEGERKYSFFTLDDGSGQIKLKCFGEDVDKFKNFIQGQTVLVIGFLRQFNNEIYITPEIIKEQNPKYLLIRKLELEKEQKKEIENIPKSQVIAIKDKILDLIKGAESENGIDLEEIILKLKETPSEIINQEVKSLLEEGIIFEPRPGRLRWLG
jgi:RPA family protein